MRITEAASCASASHDGSRRRVASAGLAGRQHRPTLWMKEAHNEVSILGLILRQGRELSDALSSRSQSSLSVRGRPCAR